MSSDIIRRIADTNKLPPEWEQDLMILKRIMDRSAKINDPQPRPVSGRGAEALFKIATVSLGPRLKDLKSYPKSKVHGFNTVWVENAERRKELRAEFIAALHRAAEAGVQLICFNEMAYPKPCSEPADSEFEQEIRELVDQYGLFVVGGSYHDCDTFHNVCPIFSAGQTVDPHAKLTSAARLDEKIRTPAGRVMRYYRTTFGRIGLLICLDAYEPSLFLRMMRQSSPWKPEEDIDLVLVPAYSPKNSQALCDACQDLSYTTGAIVVYVNCPEIRPRHAVFVAGRKMPSKGKIEGYSRRRLHRGIELHTIETDSFRRWRNDVKDSYSPILRFILGDERVGFVEKLRLE